MRRGKKFISAALGFALVFQSFSGVGPVFAAETGSEVDISQTFTDENFRSYVSSNFDTNSDGRLSEEEIDAVTSINVSTSAYRKKVSSLSGIEVFTSLENLNCYGQAIERIDVVDLENLETIKAGSNQLTEFSFPKKAENLASVDLSNNLIKTINYQNTDYSSLTDLNVYGNQLRSIDVSMLTSLVDLNIGYNALATLDLSANSNLENLRCQNMTELSSLDLSSGNHTKLKSIECSNLGNEGSIMDIDVSGATSLVTLDAENNSVSTLDISGANAIETLNLASNKLKTIDVTKETNLKTLNLSGNKGISDVNLKYNTNLINLDLSDMSLSQVDISSNFMLQTVNLSENAIAKIDLKNNGSLTSLDLSGNELQTVDVSNNAGLTELKLDNNHLVAIDLTNCLGLKDGEFSCSGNTRDISLTETDYIYSMASLVEDGYVYDEQWGGEREDDKVGDPCIRVMDKKGNSLIKDATLQGGYTLYPNIGTKEIKYSYYTGLGKQTADFVLNIENPLYLYAWYTVDGNEVNSDKTSMDLRVGDTTTLTAKDKAGKEFDKSLISWSSSDKKVFTVDNAGVLTCMGSGSATLYVNINDKPRGQLTVKCHKPVNRIVLKDADNNEYNNGDSIDLIAGSWVEKALKEKQLSATCYTDDNEVVTDSAYNEVEYRVTLTPDKESASGSDFVTLSGGTISAKKAGTVYLHCISKDSGADTVLTVNIAQMGDRVVISGITNNTLKMFTEQTKQITATVLPETATDKEVEWSSSDEYVATVDENGVVTTHNEGQATIFCKLKANNDKSARVELIVTKSAEGISLNPSECQLYLGGTSDERRITLEPEIQAEDPSLYKLTWSSDDKAVATVTSQGVVTGVAPGETVIRCAITDDMYAECKITVVQRVTGIQIIKDATVMNANTTMKVSASVRPANADNPGVAWSSSDENVATIALDGTITAHKQGRTTITCKTIDGSEKQAQFTLTVNELSTNIDVDKTAVTVYVNKNVQVTATVTPDTATKKNITWSSDNTNIATVTSGRIFGVAPGTTLVKCTTQDGSNITKTIKVTVLQQITDITLNKTAFEMNNGENAAITASIAPANAANKKLTWTSSDPSVVKVAPNGVVTAVGKGSATVTCVAADGIGAKATCRVTVKQRVTSIQLSKKQLTIFAGKYENLSTTILPLNANVRGVAWSSSNTKVAEVTGSGKVTAIKAGKATITCKATDGSGVLATCTVTVTNPVETIKLNQTQRTILKGKKYTLKATVGPKKATKKTVKWTSSDKKIATVSAKGVVTAKKAGTVTITCIAKDGSNVQARCYVTVANPVKTIKLSKKKVTIKKKSTYQLNATVGPNSAGNKTVKWTSSNKKVATVSASGLVTAKKKGKVTITVKATDGSKKTAKCTITVK